MLNLYKNTELLIDFIGVEALKDLLSNNGKTKINIDIDIVEQCKFHNDWNWIMRVVEEIESLYYPDAGNFYLKMTSDSVQIMADGCNAELFSEWKFLYSKDKIYSVYSAIIQFVKWHRKRNQLELAVLTEKL